MTSWQGLACLRHRGRKEKGGQGGFLEFLPHEVNTDLVSMTSSCAHFTVCPECVLTVHEPRCLHRHRHYYLFSTKHLMHPKIKKTVCCISSPKAPLSAALMLACTAMSSLVHAPQTSNTPLNSGAHLSWISRLPRPAPAAPAHGRDPPRGTVEGCVLPPWGTAPCTPPGSQGHATSISELRTPGPQHRHGRVGGFATPRERTGHTAARPLHPCASSWRGVPPRRAPIPRTAGYLPLRRTRSRPGHRLLRGGPFTSLPRIYISSPISGANCLVLWRLTGSLGDVIRRPVGEPRHEVWLFPQGPCEKALPPSPCICLICKGSRAEGPEPRVLGSPGELQGHPPAPSSSSAAAPRFSALLPGSFPSDFSSLVRAVFVQDDSGNGFKAWATSDTIPASAPQGSGQPGLTDTHSSADTWLRQPAPHRSQHCCARGRGHGTRSPARLGSSFAVGQRWRWLYRPAAFPGALEVPRRWKPRHGRSTHSTAAKPGTASLRHASLRAGAPAPSRSYKALPQESLNRETVSSRADVSNLLLTRIYLDW